MMTVAVTPPTLPPAHAALLARYRARAPKAGDLDRFDAWARESGRGAILRALSASYPNGTGAGEMAEALEFLGACLASPGV